MGIFTPFKRHELIPQEEALEVARRKSKLCIGIPKETHFQEKRVCLTPEAVATLIANGHQFIIESGAGEGANYADIEYAEAGAQISEDTKEVFSQDIILKVSPPSKEEIAYMNPWTFLVSALQLNIQTKEYFQLLHEKKITALSFEDITDEIGDYPIVHLLSEIAGHSSVLIAAELMNTTNHGSGLIMGGITGVRPTEMVILGAGTVGEYACKAALGLGVSVKVFDQSITRLRNLQRNINQRVYTSILEPKELKKALLRCDVLIGAIKDFKNKSRTPVVVTEEMVKTMKRGAIIIDVSIDMGGCVETSEITTHRHPTFMVHDVTHYGVTNIASRVSRTSTKALSNFFIKTLLDTANAGGIEYFLRDNKGMRNGVYCYKGIITKKFISDWFGLPFNDINLLMI